MNHAARRSGLRKAAFHCKDHARRRGPLAGFPAQVEGKGRYPFPLCSRGRVLAFGCGPHQPLEQIHPFPVLTHPREEDARRPLLGFDLWPLF